MAEGQPRYRSYGVDYWGSLERQLRDLRGFATLAHELIQNADDAGAHRIEFDVRDDALNVWNDESFQPRDFDRLSLVASGGKREEESRTIGAFGVGFVSVYQITDHPEVVSSGLQWVIRPDTEDPSKRIEVRDVAKEPGTLFRLPWATDPGSVVRTKLKVETIPAAKIETVATDVANVLPSAILFLRHVEEMQVKRNGVVIAQVERRGGSGSQVKISYRMREEKHEVTWCYLRGDFEKEAASLKREHKGNIEQKRSSDVCLAVPERPVEDGILYAFLPSQFNTGLPFHVNADFYPTSDRKSIIFEQDYQSTWNRAALRAGAQLLATNVEVLREYLTPAALWKALQTIKGVSDEARNGRREKTLAEFWDQFAAKIKSAQILYTSGGKWITPGSARLLERREDERCAPLMDALGVQTVHESLRPFYSLLVEIGVPLFDVPDLVAALERRGLVGKRNSLSGFPNGFSNDKSLRSILSLVQGLLLRRPSRHEEQSAVASLGRCAISLVRDGHLWPCSEVYKGDETTVTLFSKMGAGVGFLSKDYENEGALTRLCPIFDTKAAVGVLEGLTKEQLETARGERKFDPQALLSWFSGRKVELDKDGSVKVRLARLSLFPSSDGQLRPIGALALPGDFDDPLRLAELLDQKTLHGLGDFLGYLGARRLTFTSYALHYVPQAFKSNTTDIATKKRLVCLLAEHLGEMRDNKDVRAALAILPLVECVDGEFRPGAQVYLDDRSLRDILGSSVNYAKAPQEKKEATNALHGWLGVKDRAKPEDVLNLVQKLTARAPGPESIKPIGRVIEFLGRLFPTMSAGEKARYDSLRSWEWLPAERNPKWHLPRAVCATFQRYLFESQAKFIDLPQPVQARSTEFLEYLGIRSKPSVVQVVEHLLYSGANGLPVNREVYRHLNDNADSSEVNKLKGRPCLLLPNGRYVRPDQVYWGGHPFGPYRYQLGAELRSYTELFNKLGVKEEPDHQDALRVLEDIIDEHGPANRPLGTNRKIVLTCWQLLAAALEDETVEGSFLKPLAAMKSVPSVPGLLTVPDRIFFEDRSGLREKFGAFLDQNVIQRPESGWRAMKAAGVRDLSEVIGTSIERLVAPQEVPDLQNLMTDRARLIVRAIEARLEGSWGSGIVERLQGFRFLLVELIEVVWTFTGFNRVVMSTPEAVPAYSDQSSNTIYFVQQGAQRPWNALSREIASALAPSSADIGNAALAMRMLLSAESFESAARELDELGFAGLETFSRTPGPESTLVGVLGGEDLPDEAKVTAVQEPGTALLEGTSDGDEEGGRSGSEHPLQGGDGEKTNGRLGSEVLFVQALFEAQASEPRSQPDNPMILPPGGPKTRETAQVDTEKADLFGRTGAHKQRGITRWIPTELSQELAERFHRMAESDYSSRCQICSRGFRMGNNNLHDFVVSLVQPSAHQRTNNFGNLVCVCGWHYALMKFGQWRFLVPATGEPVAEGPGGLEQFRQVCLQADSRHGVDEMGQEYVPLPIRFWNVYDDWKGQPLIIDEEIRYSKPHWEFVQQLLQVSGS